MNAKLLGLGLLICFFSGLSACQQEPYEQGRRLYELNCQNCHLEDGEGLRGLIPPLAESDFWAADPASMACWIAYGMEGEIVVNGKTYNQPMPGVENLTPTQIANIINFVGNAWGNETPFVSYNAVEAALNDCIEISK
ncbi:MAG: cytochrome c [Bacteroidota bacterium]